MTQVYLKNSLTYVRNTNGGAKKEHFIDDFAPIGDQLWETCKPYIRVDESGHIFLNDSGVAYLNLPFQLPIWRDGNTLVAADSELIGVVESATPEELDYIVKAVNAFESNQAALRAAVELFEEALPKFNWGSSFLDHSAIQLLNTVPPKVYAALGKPYVPKENG